MHIGTMVEFAFALVGKLDVINKHSFNDFKLRVGESLHSERLQNTDLVPPLKTFSTTGRKSFLPSAPPLRIIMRWADGTEREGGRVREAAPAGVSRRKLSSVSRSWCPAAAKKKKKKTPAVCYNRMHSQL